MPVALPLTTFISQSSTSKRAYRSKRVEFGNGYEQVVKDGINAQRDEWEVTYENLTTTERNTLVTALDSVGSWDYITWQAYGDSTTKKWRLNDDGWKSSTTGLLWNVSFTLKQVY